MYKFSLIAIPFICFSFFTKAQTAADQPLPLSKTISLPALAQGNYPLSVVLKVTDVNTVVSLSDAQQLAVADFFVQEEKALAEGMESSTPQQLEQIRRQLNSRFQALLTAAQLAMYNAKRPSSHLATPNYSQPAAVPYKP